MDQRRVAEPLCVGDVGIATYQAQPLPRQSLLRAVKKGEDLLRRRRFSHPEERSGGEKLVQDVRSLAYRLRYLT